MAVVVAEAGSVEEPAAAAPDLEEELDIARAESEVVASEVVALVEVRAALAVVDLAAVSPAQGEPAGLVRRDQAAAGGAAMPASVGRAAARERVDWGKADWVGPANGAPVPRVWVAIASHPPAAAS